MRTWQKKNNALLCLLCAAMLALSSCQNDGVPIKGESITTLPPANVPYVAPIGDAALEYTDTATMYLPRHDGTRLISLTDNVAFSAAHLDAESVIRSLLIQPDNGVASPLGGDVKLSLYGANPVEVSGDVATVNLAASALQMDRKMLYLCSQAITNTLNEITGIRYVNILVMDKQIGLDLGSTLPTGAMTRSVVSDIGAAYEQMLSQRVQADEKPEDKRLTATVTLYFPLSTVNGVMSEARNVSFSSQSAESMIERVLQELSDGPVSVASSPALPLLSELLTEPPTVTEPAGSGEKLIMLHFDPTLDDMLTTMGVSRASCMASLTYTLCTFMPNITGLMVYVGDERIDHLMLGATDGLLFDDGVMLRSIFAPLLMDNCTLYLADSQGKTLVAFKRPIPYYQRTSPRALLLEVFKGPTAMDSVQGLLPVIKAGLLSDADILGLSINEDTLIVNLSNTFAQAGKNISAGQDRLLAYAMVNTLICGEKAKRICFFEGGNTPAGFTGEIYWAGLFYPSFGMKQTK